MFRFQDRFACLGHASVNLTLEVYRKPITARQQAAVEELEARLRGRVSGRGKDLSVRPLAYEFFSRWQRTENKGTSGTQKSL